MDEGAKRFAAVTGASRGIGRATAVELARRGYRVFALARSEPDLQSLVSEFPGQIVPVVLDIADDGSRQDAINTILEATDGYGLDVLVNNAGYGQFGPLEEISIDRVRRQFEVNVFGALGFTQAFLPGMRQRGFGYVVNMSSAAGRLSTPFLGVYSASKFALEAMSDALRRELRPFGVHVVLIEPGPIRSSFGEVVGELEERNPDSPYAPYVGEWMGARGGAYQLLTRSSETVGRVVARAVSSSQPRARYTVTLPAKLGTLTHRLVPDRVLDWFFARTTKPS